MRNADDDFRTKAAALQRELDLTDSELLLLLAARNLVIEASGQPNGGTLGDAVEIKVEQKNSRGLFRDGSTKTMVISKRDAQKSRKLFRILGSVIMYVTVLTGSAAAVYTAYHGSKKAAAEKPVSEYSTPVATSGQPK